MLVPLGAALVSCGLLALAVVNGWLGPDVDRGAEFCEVSCGLLAQPVNTWSNLGFVAAGLAVGWHARGPERLGHTMAARPFLAVAYAVVVVLLGPASAAMHATESHLGGVLDLTSMYLVASWAAAYALLRLRGWSLRRFPGVFVALVVACELVGALDMAVPVLMHPGNVAFLTLLVTALVAEIRLRRRTHLRTQLGWGVGAVGSLVVAFVIWNLGQHGWCDPGSVWQAHGAWHLLCAVSAYCLFRLYASEEAAAESTNQTVSS
ncbi:MAG: ceramidase domain-containing protein [Nocardioides sp.]|uniref:ceramidase domain-containing protein n=1 Tax=Nocardioides sp. TaxID=35761 RepID=UPI003F07E1AB